MKKVKVGILGTGNIGSDLLIKVMRSPLLECGIFAGRNPDSSGCRRAEQLGLNVSYKSIQGIEEDPSCCDIVFDATSANVHFTVAPILKRLNKFSLDLTPSGIGRMCVPVINLEECLNESEVSMVTCGGQAAVPIAYAISQVHPEAAYCELVASISSRSAGAGTRDNIDEFTQSTRDALKFFSGFSETKAIIILNPAEPPIIMRNTIYTLIENPDMPAICREVSMIAEKIQQYVPGYRVIVGPVFENNRVTTTVEVKGAGDFLPEYSGNLDIITSAAVKIAEAYALKKMGKSL